MIRIPRFTAFPAVLTTAVFALALLPLPGRRAAADENWAEALFPVKSHDFGTVARNAKTSFVFPLENCYATDVRVAGVRTSCGCTTPSVLKAEVTTYERGGILAVFNTDSFLGQRGATITVTLDKPRFAEVQLRVDGEIRGEVSTDPGGLEFGNVPSATAVERQLTVSYHGPQADWRIESIRCGNPHLRCRAEPLNSSTARRAYRLTATLAADTPPGDYNEPILLATNDPRAAEIPIDVSARVQPPVTVSPAHLFLGAVPPGERVQRKLVVVGREPFRIVGVDCDGCFQCTIDSQPRKVHIVPLTFTAGDREGKLVRTIRVRTDLEEEWELECTATAAVVAPAS